MPHAIYQPWISHASLRDGQSGESRGTVLPLNSSQVHGIDRQQHNLKNICFLSFHNKLPKCGRFKITEINLS